MDGKMIALLCAAGGFVAGLMTAALIFWLAIRDSVMKGLGW